MASIGYECVSHRVLLLKSTLLICVEEQLVPIFPGHSEKAEVLLWSCALAFEGTYIVDSVKVGMGLSEAQASVWTRGKRWGDRGRG